MKMNAQEEITTQKLDGLLSLVRDAPLAEPSSEIRENLLRMTAISPGRTAKRLPAKGNFHWARWAILSSACAAMLLGAEFYHLLWLHGTVPPAPIDVSPAAHLEANHDLGEGSSQLPRSPRKAMAVHSRRADHLALRSTPTASTGFDFALPYSNPDVANGTATTIQISVSREDLFVLGVPLSDGSDQRRYLAEITLGDDGLLRSIHIPLPLKTIN